MATIGAKACSTHIGGLGCTGKVGWRDCAVCCCDWYRLLIVTDTGDGALTPEVVDLKSKPDASHTGHCGATRWSDTGVFTEGDYQWLMQYSDAGGQRTWTITDSETGSVWYINTATTVVCPLMAEPQCAWTLFTVGSPEIKLIDVQDTCNPVISKLERCCGSESAPDVYAEIFDLWKNSTFTSSHEVLDEGPPPIILWTLATTAFSKVVKVGDYCYKPCATWSDADSACNFRKNTVSSPTIIQYADYTLYDLCKEACAGDFRYYVVADSAWTNSDASYADGTIKTQVDGGTWNTGGDDGDFNVINTPGVGVPCSPPHVNVSNSADSAIFTGDHDFGIVATVGETCTYGGFPTPRDGSCWVVNVGADTIHIITSDENCVQVECGQQYQLAEGPLFDLTFSVLTGPCPQWFDRFSYSDGTLSGKGDWVDYTDTRKLEVAGGTATFPDEGSYAIWCGNKADITASGFVPSDAWTWRFNLKRTDTDDGDSEMRFYIGDPGGTCLVISPIFVSTAFDNQVISQLSVWQGSGLEVVNDIPFGNAAGGDFEITYDGSGTVTVSVKGTVYLTLTGVSLTGASPWVVLRGFSRHGSTVALDNMQITW